MRAKQQLPPPENISFILMDVDKRLATPVESLPPEEWRSLRFDILKGLCSGAEDEG